MSEQSGQSWRERRRGAPRQASVHRRRLQLESLEERALLAGYTVVDLGTLGGNLNFGSYFINDSGQIAASTYPDGEHRRAVLYSGGAWTILPTLGADYTDAYGINNAGEVLGDFVSINGPNAGVGAFLYSHGTISKLSNTGSYYAAGASGINNAGEIVGSAYFGFNGGYGGIAASYSDGTWSEVGTLGGTKYDESSAQSINDGGEIVGYSSINGEAFWTSGQTEIWHPFLYSDGAWTDLSTLGFSSVSHINNAGEIIGTGANGDALLCSRGGATVDLGYGVANGINDSGYVVGESRANGHAFLYADGETRDLNDLIPSDSGWTLTSAYGINNNGQIVAVANASGENHVVLLNPGPVPKKVEPDTNPKNPGGLVVTYQVFQKLPAGPKFEISVYWATGAKPDNALSVQPQHGQAKDVGDALYTKYVDSSSEPGTYTFKISADKLVTAPNAASYLMIVADPKETFKGHSYPNAILADKAHIGELSTSQLQKLMPGLSTADADRYAPLLTQYMHMPQYGIDSLEQEAMFLGQLAVESNNLRRWVEGPIAPDFFTLHYWECPGNGRGDQNFIVNSHGERVNYGTKWGGLGASVPTAGGLRLAVPATGTANTRQLQLHWSNAAGPGFATVTFTRNGNSFVYLWAGSNQEPAYTARMLVVDPATHHALLTITNTLGEFQPQDASDFRGRGPIQLTGRKNYQEFADAVGRPDIMMNPQLLSDKVNHPEIGIEAAAWYFSTHGCNAATDRHAWGASGPFNSDITGRINARHLNEPERLKRYLEIRALLLDANF
jgi:probable HAF family extracellular repeat protein